MKKLLLLSIVGTALLTSCGNKTPENATAEKAPAVAVDTTLMFFGDTITQDLAVPVEQLAEKLKGKDSLKIKVTGVIDEVCQKKGCWMNINIGNNQSMRVRFKDYGFFMPKDAAGKTVIFEGVAFSDTTSVEELRHYATDAGQSKEEIKKITEPEINIGFEANGVIIKK